jgi:hypothetical protein
MAWFHTERAVIHDRCCTFALRCARACPPFLAHRQSNSTAHTVCSFVDSMVVPHPPVHHRLPGMKVCDDCCQARNEEGFRGDPTGQPREVCSACRSRLRRELKMGQKSPYVQPKKRGKQPRPVPTPKRSSFQSACTIANCTHIHCNLWHANNHAMLDEKKHVSILETPPQCPNKCLPRSVRVKGKLDGFWLGGAVFMECQLCGEDLPPLVQQEPLQVPAPAPSRVVLVPSRDSIVLPHGKFPCFCRLLFSPRWHFFFLDLLSTRYTR